MTASGTAADVKTIGSRMRRKEDPRLLTGRGRFLDDIAVPGMLEAAVLRSPVPHARITRIDASAALELPGVFAVITGEEVRAACATTQPVIWRMFPGQHMSEHYALATDKVRYVGQAVAAVAAVDRYIAEDALELIEVDYEELPAVSTVDEHRGRRTDDPRTRGGSPTGRRPVKRRNSRKTLRSPPPTDPPPAVP
nr:hypothetical protein [Amycolatopsis jejuensis]